MENSLTNLYNNFSQLLAKPDQAIFEEMLKLKREGREKLLELLQKNPRRALIAKIIQSFLYRPINVVREEACSQCRSNYFYLKEMPETDKLVTKICLGCKAREIVDAR